MLLMLASKQNNRKSSSYFWFGHFLSYFVDHILMCQVLNSTSCLCLFSHPFFCQSIIPVYFRPHSLLIVDCILYCSLWILVCPRFYISLQSFRLIFLCLPFDAFILDFGQQLNIKAQFFVSFTVKAFKVARKLWELVNEQCQPQDITSLLRLASKK